MFHTLSRAYGYGRYHGLHNHYLGKREASNAILQTNFSSVQTQTFNQCVKHLDDPYQLFDQQCLLPKHHITKRAKK